MTPELHRPTHLSNNGTGTPVCPPRSTLLHAGLSWMCHCQVTSPPTSWQTLPAVWTNINHDHTREWTLTQTYHILEGIPVYCILNRFSKTCQLVPLKRLPTAMKWLKTLFQHYGTMTSREHSIWRGSHFISRVWRAFFSLLRVHVTFFAGYHPQTKMQTERKVQEIGCFLRTYCHTNQHSRCPFLSWI